MGIKYFCDNCGKEHDRLIDNDEPTIYFVKIQAKGDSFYKPDFMLCAECTEKLRKILKDGFQ